MSPLNIWKLTSPSVCIIQKEFHFLTLLILLISHSELLVCQSLISINNSLGQPEAANGLLAYAQDNLKVKLKACTYPTPYTLHPTPYTLHPTPYNLHTTPYTLHPTPYTLHPTHYTLHTTHYTLTGRETFKSELSTLDPTLYDQQSKCDIPASRSSSKSRGTRS
jgi:hypothetical protein